MDVDGGTMVSTKAPNVWGVGDITNIPTSKTAVSAGTQARIVVQQLTRRLRGDTTWTLPDENKYDGYTVRPSSLHIIVPRPLRYATICIYENKRLC
jgi:NADH dehydrogenase FAD-containing subunit